MMKLKNNQLRKRTKKTTQINLNEPAKPATWIMRSKQLNGKQTNKKYDAQSPSNPISKVEIEKKF